MNRLTRATPWLFAAAAVVFVARLSITADLPEPWWRVVVISCGLGTSLLGWRVIRMPIPFVAAMVLASARLATLSIAPTETPTTDLAWHTAVPDIGVGAGTLHHRGDRCTSPTGNDESARLRRRLGDSDRCIDRDVADRDKSVDHRAGDQPRTGDRRQRLSADQCADRHVHGRADVRRIDPQSNDPVRRRRCRRQPGRHRDQLVAPGGRAPRRSTRVRGRYLRGGVPVAVCRPLARRRTRIAPRQRVSTRAPRRIQGPPDGHGDGPDRTRSPRSP